MMSCLIICRFTCAATKIFMTLNKLKKISFNRNETTKDNISSNNNIRQNARPLYGLILYLVEKYSEYKYYMLDMGMESGGVVAP